MFQHKKIAVLIAGIGCAMAMPSYADDIAADTDLDEVVVTGKRLSTDQKGENDVYRKNVANDYLSKEELERYQFNAAGDVLKGLNNVYSMNTRTAGGAMTPNIRGITGKGRIPVTIDGVEQTVDVWMNNYGVGDRNYIDPNLFRSIAVDKSPDISTGRKSGVGGSIAIRTIEADDIIPEGKNYGVQVKTEFSNNASKPTHDFGKYLGVHDYRTIGATADGAGGGIDPYTGQTSPYGLNVDDVAKARQKTGSDNWKFGDDKSIFVSGAWKNEMTDALLAYSYRKKGNYFAGKHGADDYLNNPISKMSGCYSRPDDIANCYVTSDSFVPNMAKMFKPGQEVLNSNTETTTYLAKNNWYLPDNQKISLEFMRNDIKFGELNPGDAAMALNMAEANADIYPNMPTPQIQNIDSHIKADTYKIGYEWNPDDNQWINLQANLWHHRTESKRYQSGGMSLGTYSRDQQFDNWYNCNVRNTFPGNGGIPGVTTCAELGASWGFDSSTTYEEIMKPTWEGGKGWFGSMADMGAFKVVSGALQKTKATRSGFDLSNTFEVNDRFRFSLGGDFQREKLDENVNIINGDDMFNIYGMTTGLANMAGPRSGRRQEWGINAGFDWQATDRLNIQAGVRYHEFWATNDALAKERAKKNERYAWGGGNDKYISGLNVPYMELMNDEEISAWQDFNNTNWNQVGWDEYEKRSQEFKDQYGFDPYGYYAVNTMGTVEDNYSSDKAYYKAVAVYAPYKNGKLDTSNIADKINPSMFDETVSNPQGLNGTYYKYLVGIASERHGSSIHNTYNDIKDNVYTTQNALSPGSNGNNHGNIREIISAITEEQKWQQPQKMRGNAWSPMIALTYDLSDNQKLFARYAQMTRFPSLYEATAVDSDGLISTPTTPGLDLKPERSTNWEVGYSFNFAPYWSRLQGGDVRLTYYDNKIDHIIDTTETRRITQYDKKINKGIELQARMDTGRYFANLGATYRLKSVMCDRDTAIMYDLYLHRIPECIEGGFGAARFYQAMQPKYSVNLDLGTRLLNDNLELGMRGTYHSAPKRDQYDDLIVGGFANMFTRTGKPYHWKPALVLDAYGRYDISKNLSANFSISNLTNRYYLDPMSNVAVPAPGRTVTLGLTGKF